MRCPSCKEVGRDKVIDSRMTESGKAIRRRRQCTACGRRYTTKERVEGEARLTVIKKGGSRMPFDIERVLKGMRHACYKRPIPLEALQKMAEAVEEELFKRFEREVPTHAIGASVAARLRELDHVAYVRFASVYRDFKDLDEMVDEIEAVRDSTDSSTPGQGTLFE